MCAINSGSSVKDKLIRTTGTIFVISPQGLIDVKLQHRKEYWFEIFEGVICTLKPYFHRSENRCANLPSKYFGS